MAEATIRIDDITGNPLDETGETILFAYRGKDYSIDLTRINAQAFDRVMAPFLEHARPAAPSPRGHRHGSQRRQRSQRSSLVRAWAAANPGLAGQALNERGRIPNDVIKRYEAATGGALTTVE